MPPATPIFIPSLQKPTTLERSPTLLFHANVFKTNCLLETLSFPQSKRIGSYATQ